MKKTVPLFSLKDKIVYITGGLGLLGSEIAALLSSFDATIIILDIDDKKGKKFSARLHAHSHNVFYEHFDITDTATIDHHMEYLWKKYHGMDVWINTAYPRTDDWANPIESVSVESWSKNIAMHMTGYCWSSRRACMMMQKQKSGSVINFGSIHGVLGNDFSMYENTTIIPPPAYAAIKGGIISFSRFLASYYGKFNIRVNTICPGGIEDRQNKIFIKNYSKKTPLNRMGKPGDIAPAVLFLASSASSYITGTTMMVDGGWSMI